MYLHETMPKNELGVLTPSVWEKLGLSKGGNDSVFENFTESSLLFDEILNDLDGDEKDFLEVADALLLDYFLQNNLKMPQII